MKRARHKRGFTLIELLVVIMILGLLATFYVAKVVPAGEKAKRDLTVSQMAILTVAVESFRTDVGRFPESLQDLVIMPSDLKADRYRLGGYLKEIPVDGWKNAFGYRRVPGMKGFDLISYGADAREGGEGYDTDIVK